MQDLIIRVSYTSLLVVFESLSSNKCERLSAETGCWLQISAQHVNANLGFFNYISPRLRLEAKPEITEVLNQLNIMYSSLLYARRLDAISLRVQAEKSKAELERAQQELAEKEAEIADLKLKLRVRSSSS